MLNRMRYNPPLLIKLENEQAAKLLIIPRIATQPFRNLVHLLRRLYPAVKHTHTFSLRLPARLPSHDEALVADAGAMVRVGRPASVLDDAFGEDGEADVSDDGDAAPGHGRGPEGGVVCYAAADGGEVGVGGGEEVECYMWGEDFGGVGGGEECWEAGLEDAEGWVGRCVSALLYLSLEGVGLLFPSFNVRSSGGAWSSLKPDSSGAWCFGLELVNHTSGKTSRSTRTWARERQGVNTEV